MRRGNLSKLGAVAFAILLLAGDFQASSALPYNDGDKSLQWVPGCRSGSRKTFQGQKNCIDGESLFSHGKKTVPFRSLRSSIPSPPPPPKLNKQNYYASKAPPPQLL